LISPACLVESLARSGYSARVPESRNSPRERLETFIARYPPAVAAVARAALKKLRARTPGAVELVYDNYNALVIGFGPTERAGDAVLSLALYPRWVNLFFLQGADLPDPQRLLQGDGTVVRRIQLRDAAVLDAPAVRGLVTAALKQTFPIPPARRSRIVIKAVAARQRSRRPAPARQHPARTR
jgi:hypothetical protein